MGEPILTNHEVAMEAFDVIDAIVAQQALGSKSLSDLRGMKDTDEPLWVIKNFIRVGSVHQFFGTRRTGKTNLMLDMVLRIANGDDYFLGFPIDKHGPCLYFMLEEGARNLRDVLKTHPYYEKEEPVTFYEFLKLKLDSDSDWDRLEKACYGHIVNVIDPIASIN